MLATSLRQLRTATASRALLTQSAQALGGVAPFSADSQPSDPKTVLAILYKAGAAAEEKRLLGKFHHCQISREHACNLNASTHSKHHQ